MVFIKKELSTFQKTSCTKTYQKKKNRGKRFIKNWRPISLLNVNVKLISKVLSNRIKNFLPNWISSNQNAYVTNRFISKGGRLISDILEVTDILNMEDYLLITDIKKAFDSNDRCFLFAIPEKYDFKKNFLRWIETLLNNQESCIINSEITTHYFKLKKGTRQDDLISAHLFILALEAVLHIIKLNKNSKGLNIFDHKFLYTAYVDDTAFFLKYKNSFFATLNIFHKFSLVFGGSPNTTKCKKDGIGTLKGVNVALCGMKCLNLTKETVKILGVHFSYNKKLEHEINFQSDIIFSNFQNSPSITYNYDSARNN